MAGSSTAERSAGGVSLPEGGTGSSFLHGMLASAVEAFPEELSQAELPQDARSFKPRYGEALARFEAARQASSRRVEIARHLSRETRTSIRFVDGDRALPFDAYMRGEGTPQPTRVYALGGTPGLPIEVPFEGRSYRGREVLGLIDSLAERYLLSAAAARGLRWIVEHAGAAGTIDLSGRRFALMGAGAELAPTRMLLAAGASVLWNDVVDPPKALLESSELSGALHVPEERCNLLLRPRDVRATISAFAESGPVDVGMFAYAGGASQEWRLGAAMNGIVRSLDRQQVASLCQWVSPTTVAAVYPEDVLASEVRLRTRPAWQAVLAGLGMLPTPGHRSHGDARVARSIVPIQGVSYQAAQYISKLMAAECYAVYGLSLDAAEPDPVTVSANVAGITKTRSMGQPVFAAAFLGAPSFGVHIFDPDTTRALTTLLLCHDLLNPQAPSASDNRYAGANQKAAAVLSQQVHGGLYGLPYELYPAIRAAAILGLGKRPSMLPRLLGA